MNIPLPKAGPAGPAMTRLHPMAAEGMDAFLPELKAMAHAPGAYRVHSARLLAIEAVPKLQPVFLVRDASYFVNAHFAWAGLVGVEVPLLPLMSRTLIVSLLAELNAIPRVMVYRVHSAIGVAIGALNEHSPALLVLAV